jgi:hypothetical protein
MAKRPVPRQQLIDPADGRAFADPVEHIGEPSLWIYIIELGRRSEQAHCKSGRTAYARLTDV